MEATIGATVTSVVRVSPAFVRVGLRVDDGAWSSLGVADEFVHLEVGAQTLDADGHAARHYTVSAVTSEGFEVEVALHGHGPGSAWAESATLGDSVRVSEPKAYYAAPGRDVERVLIGDATALPAIARILAEADAAERFRVVIELASLADSRELPTPARADIAWHVGGNGVSVSAIANHAAREVEAALADSPSPVSGDGDPPVYAWVACESSVSRRVRSHLRRDIGLPTNALRIVGYWHADAQRLRRVWAGLSDAQRARYEDIWRDDRSDEENWEQLEPYLAELGL